MPKRKTAKSQRTAPTHFARGQVWFVTDDPDHPAVGDEIWPGRYGVIVSSDPIAEHSGAVTVVYATTSRTKVSKATMSPTHVKCKMSNKDVVLLCEQPTTVDKSRLERYSHTISTTVMKKVEEALCVALNLSTIDCSAAFAKWEKQIGRGTSVIATSQADLDTFADDAAKLARDNARLRAERDSYRTLLRVREEAERDAATEI